jgi:hypothetical protein
MRFVFKTQTAIIQEKEEREEYIKYILPSVFLEEY